MTVRLVDRPVDLGTLLHSFLMASFWCMQYSREIRKINVAEKRQWIEFFFVLYTYYVEGFFSIFTPFKTISVYILSNSVTFPKIGTRVPRNVLFSSVSSMEFNKLLSGWQRGRLLLQLIGRYKGSVDEKLSTFCQFLDIAPFWTFFEIKTSFHFQAQASTDADRGNAIEPKRGGRGKSRDFFTNAREISYPIRTQESPTWNWFLLQYQAERSVEQFKSKQNLMVLIHKKGLAVIENKTL